MVPGADQVNVSDCPGAIVCADASKEIGATEVTSVMFETVPFGPLQVISYSAVALLIDIVSLPEVAFVPDQPPDAIQLVVFVEVQVMVTGCPSTTGDGLAEIATVGVDGGGLPDPVTVNSHEFDVPFTFETVTLTVPGKGTFGTVNPRHVLPHGPAVA